MSNQPKATMFHDAGAVAQCQYCKRYTLDRQALSDRQPVCACGKQHGWSGSFKPPGPDAQWHGPAPVPTQPTASASGERDSWTYRHNILTGVANWLEGRSSTVWAKEFRHTALMMTWAADLRRIDAALASKPPQVEVSVPLALLVDVTNTIDHPYSIEHTRLRGKLLDVLAAVPSQPVEQVPSEAQLQAALSECLEAFPIPEPGSPLERDWMVAMGEPLGVPQFVRAALAAQPRSTEPQADCCGGMPCTTCPDREKCQRGCVRQTEFVGQAERKGGGG